VIAIYANDGNKPFEVDIRANMGLNTRYQYVLLYSLGWPLLRAAGDDINAAITAGALPVGEAAGLPLHHFTLDQTAGAHEAVESGTTGKVLITVADL
jgi:NADPH2:quinone reductase